MQITYTAQVLSNKLSPFISTDFWHSLLYKVTKMWKTCPYNHKVHLPVFLWDPEMDTAHLSLLQTPWSLREPLQSRVSRHRALFLLITSHGLPLAKQREGKQGGDTHGGRGWRSKLIPHVPQEETFQAASAYLAGGRVMESSKPLEHLAALSRTFRPHTAVHQIHMDPFSSTMASQGTIYFFGKHQSSRKSLLQRNQKKELKIDIERETQSRAAKQNELYWSRVQMTHLKKIQRHFRPLLQSILNLSDSGILQKSAQAKNTSWQKEDGLILESTDFYYNSACAWRSC